MNLLNRYRCERIDEMDHLWALPLKLAGMPCLDFRQAWLAEPETDFMPANVRMGWTPEGFGIWAVLQDRDIFNPVTTFNQPAFLAGDVLEIFLRPQGAEAYDEFHISPHNQLFQYRIPSSTAFQQSRSGGIREDWLIPYPVLESETRIDGTKELWEVFVKIPMAGLGFPPLSPGQIWNFSFCRYDYSRNRENPLLSSSSPYKKINFHEIESWNEFVLA